MTIGPSRTRDEVRIHGQHACRALFERRRADILRIYLTEPLTPRFGDVLAWSAREHKPYKLVAPAELEAITESRHHEGICMVARPKPLADWPALLAAPGPTLLIASAEVGNPHNLGALCRIAAHFGSQGLLLAGGASLSPAVHRVAQGGVEALAIAAPGPLEAALSQARRAGFTIAATSSHDDASPTDLYRMALPARLLLILGSEARGLAPALLAAAELRLRVPGTGDVESLNVAAAAAVIMGEYWRTHRAAAAPPPEARARPTGTGGAPRARGPAGRQSKA